MLLSPLEQAVIRAWIKGLSAGVYADQRPPGITLNQWLPQLRQRLSLKARRLNRPWQAFFKEERQNSATWQQTALSHLQALLSQPDLPPQLEQPLQFWLDDTWSEALAESGLVTVQQWFHWRATQGNDWWRRMPGIGQRGARALEQRLQILWPERPALPPLPTPIYQEDSAVRPLERLKLAAELDGSQGLWRGHSDCFLPATNDLEAINAWLSRHPAASHTYRAYRREAERLLLWSLVDGQKPLSSLTTPDLAAYRRFLQAPTPAERWIGPNRPKASTEWKPFSGPLSARSIQHAEIILTHLFRFLVNQGYLRFNPYTGLPKHKNSASTTRLNTQHALSLSQWQFINHYLETQRCHSTGLAAKRWLRLHLMVRLLYATGLRLHEIAQATKGDLLTMEREGQRQHWLAILGKGQKAREVPCPESLIRCIEDAQKPLTGTPWRSLPESAPLIPGLRQPFQRNLTPKAIYVELKHFFEQAARVLEATDPESANALAQATTHWLRHTHGTHAVAKGIPLTVIRDNMGHANLSTTSQYLHTDADERYQAFRDFE